MTHHQLNKKTSSSSSSSNPNNPYNSTSSCCHHSPSATLDLLILILVLFSAAFLISSYIFHSLSLLLPPISLSISILIDVSSLYLFFILSVISFEICCTNRSRKCGTRGCRGLKKAMEFDLQLHTEEMLRSGAKGVKEVEDLPWKGVTEMNPEDRVAEDGSGERESGFGVLVQVWVRGCEPRRLGTEAREAK